MSNAIVVVKRYAPKQNGSHSEVKQTSAAAEGSAGTGTNAAEYEVEEGGRKSSCYNVMVLTRRQSAERGNQTTPQNLPTAGPYPLLQVQAIGGQDYAAPVSFYDVLAEDIRRLLLCRGSRARHFWRTPPTTLHRSSDTCETASSLGASALMPCRPEFDVTP